MNTIGPTLQDFSLAAAQATDSSKIKVSGQEVKSTRLPTWASTNHAAMTAFIAAIRSELGSTIADATETRLHTILGNDRPLTARLVRESIDDAVRMAQTRLNARDKFLSDIDPQHGFTSAFDQAVAPLRGRLDDKGLAQLREAMKQELIGHFPPEANDAGNPAALASYMISRSVKLYGCCSMLDLPIAGQGGVRSGDLVSLGLLMGNNVKYAGVLCQFLPSMRALQPQGELTPETIWQSLFNEPLPEGVPTQGAAFSEALSRHLDTGLEMFCPGKSEKLCMLCRHMPLDRAREIITTGRPVTMSDLSSPGLSLSMRLSAKFSGETLIARDVTRRMSATMAGPDKATISTPPRIVVGDKTFIVGKDTPFAFASDADKLSYRQGNLSTFSSGIMDAFRELCGGTSANPRQAEMLGMLASQAPMRSLLGTGGTGVFKGIVDTPIIEHSSTTVSVNMGDDGVAHVRVSTSDDPDAVCFSGFASISYDVAPDGTATPVDAFVAPVFGSAAQALAAQIKESGRSTGELRHAVAEALQAGTLSQWEADRLEARLADRVVSPEDLSETARNMLTLQTTLTSREFAEYVNSEREQNAITAEEARFLLSSVNAEGGTDAAGAAGGTGAVAAEEAGNRFSNPPRITDKRELVDFLRGLPAAPVHGKVEHAGKTTNFEGRECSLYTFSGLVFRGDSRDPRVINADGGFKSKDDLSIPEHLRDAQGLGQAVGATGTAGVSCARELGRCLPYCDYGNMFGRGFVYIIDTTKLGEGRQAYDMAAISVRNGLKSQDESGGEVNVTDIPYSAVVGWLEIPNADDLHKGDPDGGVAALMASFNDRHVTFNRQYQA